MTVMDKAMGNLGPIGDRAFLITAGASGIGRACAETIAEAGGRVAILDAEPAAAEAVAADLAAQGATAIALRADLRRREEIEAAVESAERQLGPLTGLVAATGRAVASPAADVTLADWNAVLDTALTSGFVACQVVGRRMISQQGGSIVVLASSDALGARAGRVSHCAAQFALVGLVRNLALEWGRFGIRVNCVAAGTTLDHAESPEEQIAGVLLDRTPLGRLAEASELARVATFLLSDAAAYVSGAVIPVDGGITAGFITRWNGADYASKRMRDRGDYAPPAASR